MRNRRTFDLNNADDARDYLTTLEADDHLYFIGDDTAQELTDDEAIEVAGMVFLSFNSSTAGNA